MDWKLSFISGKSLLVSSPLMARQIIETDEVTLTALVD
jgi:hypothetical protein